MSSRNKEIVEKVNAAFAANDLEGFLALCADDVEWSMIGEKTCKGKAAKVKRYCDQPVCMTERTGKD